MSSPAARSRLPIISKPEPLTQQSAIDIASQDATKSSVSLPTVIPAAARSPRRSPSPISIKRKRPKSYAVDVVCGIPHPSPTHALAASHDFSHLITGSEDGYIRDYDVFAGLNGKTFLTANQRHHCGVGGVVDGLMKAGQIRSWWENSDMSQINEHGPPPMTIPVTPVYSLLMHSQALWALSGTNVGIFQYFNV